MDAEALAVRRAIKFAKEIGVPRYWKETWCLLSPVYTLKKPEFSYSIFGDLIKGIQEIAKSLV